MDNPSFPSPTTPTNTSACVVWHRRNLRTTDHGALTYATKEYDHILPLFTFDPQFYRSDGLACDSRIKFLHESLTDLNSQYNNHNGHLTYAHGNPIKILSTLHDNGWDIVATADPTGRYGWKRDNTAADTCDVKFIDADGLIRNTTHTRDNWSDHITDWYHAPQHTPTLNTTNIATDNSTVSIKEIESTYAITPEKTAVPTGGTTAGETRLKQFTRNLTNYPDNISAPIDAETGTSRLSPYLRFGCLSVREVYQYVNEHGIDGAGKDMFFSRLYWNRHYNQKLEDWHGWMDTAVNPVMEDFHKDTYDEQLVNAWKHGQTGYPMVDASMRCLKQTGWLNFRMRAMCASFLCDLLQQPWKIGADWFYYHLIDADPAINYTQFQNQAGVVGVNMMRVYNPQKQVQDNDPHGEFISKWVPELAPLPVAHLDTPSKTPVHIQKETGVSIGDDYPYPIVEYEHARKQGLDKLARVQDEAANALQHPEVARRASLARTGQTQEIPDTTNSTDTTDIDEATGQQSLSSFK